LSSERSFKKRKKKEINASKIHSPVGKFAELAKKSTNRDLELKFTVVPLHSYRPMLLTTSKWDPFCNNKQV